MGKRAQRNRYNFGSRHVTGKRQRDTFLSAFRERVEQEKSARIVLSGDFALEIEGDNEILEYDDSLVMVKTGKKKLLIAGTDLLVERYGEESLSIKGRILSLSWL